ncbi:hypothetical protein [Chryseobacterium sp. ERMR1:04]|uniref:hypothetical protein n=1 Tax=Chryseobacterium sp. ERMR1:04 TaxID=1705393 RepID=UPI0006C8BEAD|nr:hypothetical protein [Chryseobacterium sp. ERMR1:04]KPH12883.1 hypothetical protein AMQ68_14620 [Chryseobacterium sp. ERMR1:04]
MKKILILGTLLFFYLAYCQERLDNLNKVFDKYEKKYQQQNNPYTESSNDTEQIREIKQALNTRRQKRIEINDLAKKQEEESNQYQNIANNALKRAANSISPIPKAPSDLIEAAETAGRTPEQKAYDNAAQTVGISNANDGIIIANNNTIIKTETETKEINKEMILAFCFVALLFLLIIIRRKKIKN